MTRAVRVIDLITNMDMAAFQANGGLQAFINRLEVGSLKIILYLFPPLACMQLFLHSLASVLYAIWTASVLGRLPSFILVTISKQG